MQGQITKIQSSLYTVDTQEEKIPCVLRGRFRKQHILPRVGDYVVFDKEKKVIDEILPRKNEFDRPFVSNIDLAFIVTSVKDPDLSPSLLDKLLVLMELHAVEPILCITKMDLLTEEEKRKVTSFFEYYKKLGYRVVTNKDLSIIKSWIPGHTCVFTGQTGVGKSTLLNHLHSEWNLKTGEISKALGRGKHTTRNVELFSFLGGKLLDTPGFSSLALSSTREEIRACFREFASCSCPFSDCTHTKEKECVVKRKVEEGTILKSRYLSYLQLIKEEEKK